MRTIQADLAVVGAGPAGVMAALTAARHGVRTVVLDEQAEPGGRMLSQVHPDPRRRGGWLRGPAIVRELVAQARQAGVQFLPRTEVWGLWPGWELGIGGPGATADLVQAPAVLVATGAAQAGLPFPGWTLPGVIAAGAAQVMMHQYRILPGRRVLVVGADPLALAVAQELRLFDVAVVGVVLPPPGPATGELASPRAALATALRLAHLAPGALLRTAGRALRRWPGLVARLFPRAGLRGLGVPLQLRRCVLAALGEESVRAAVLADLTPAGEVIPGTEREVAVDALCVSGGLYPLTELAAAVGGCEMAYIEELGGRVPLHGPDLQTTVPGLFVAGSATGVEGAPVALAQGEQAGIGTAAYLGRLPAAAAASALAEAARRVERARREALLSFHPQVERGRERLAQLWQDSRRR